HRSGNRTRARNGPDHLGGDARAPRRRSDGRSGRSSDRPCGTVPTACDRHSQPDDSGRAAHSPARRTRACAESDAGRGAGNPAPALAPRVLRLLGTTGRRTRHALCPRQSLRLRTAPAHEAPPPHLPPPGTRGSSGSSARLAADLGMPSVFANHFASGATTGMKIYRDNFTPGAYGDQPQTFVTANVVVAPTAEEAQLRSEPFLLQM